MGADQPGPAGAEGATTRHVRVLSPAEGLLAFYDGRVPGYRFAAEDDWVDVGALGDGG